MGRTVDEVVHVKTDGGGTPEAFIWRGRLYVVREVLASWSARLPWWQGVEARALRGEALAVHGSTALAAQPGRRGPAADEHVWRLLASAGFTAEPGTFELAGAAPGPEAGSDGRDGPGQPEGQQWRLVRVVD